MLFLYCVVRSRFSETDEDDECEIKSSQVQYLYIQMQFCPNGTLRKWLQNRNGSLKEMILDESQLSTSIELFGQMVSAVEYLHTKRFIHRDLTVSLPNIVC